MYYINDRGKLVDMVYRAYRVHNHNTITFDKCYICGWIGLSEDVKNNQCPRCGSEDMDDIDGDQYADL